ncbi:MULTISPECIES: ABC transporter permease subunit [unclassified Acidovorax]|uniref:ABC transporter permease n=1 Tax=unclassified Acidovorax TaxID=2684926 RepID=UPI0023DE4879|nr:MULTISPECIES: ABC transporter permease subunit [unclassified Acidovorax]GKS83892.1 ABC transporter permease subunit [Acidovorax sp. SUPP1855]GKS89649.1 ABC transporter permease subunit [Acidovorax sp. SUPP2539]GKS94755.1 ABC transporter permease subunit [Acidovorax sp. SUPP2825]GKS99540.1 ABC transporter permease subunit [Acidovorax sp. SUPP3434]
MVRAAALLYAAYLLLPIALLLLGSVGERWTNTLLPTGLTGRWYAELWADPAFRKAFGTSLLVALSACAINTVLALPLAHALYHGARRGRAGMARLVSALPIAVPPVTLAFGYVIVFNTDALPWLGSLPLLIAAHAVATLPYLTQTLLADLRHQDLARLEAAAATLGASGWRQFTTVVLPSLRQSLLSGLVMVAALSVGEFNLSNLLAGFQSRTYPVLLLQAFYGATGFACAATVVLLVLAGSAALFSSSLVKHRP